MDKLLTIGQLGKEVGLATKTIRFYEDIGLINHAHRASNGYRVYNINSIEELTIIKYARDLGLPINEIKKLMNGCKGKSCQHTKDYLTNEIDSYLKLLISKTRQLTELEHRLHKLKRDLNNPLYCNNKGKYCCDILAQLTKMPT